MIYIYIYNIIYIYICIYTCILLLLYHILGWTYQPPKKLGGLRTPGSYACLYHNFCFSEPVINK